MNPRESLDKINFQRGITVMRKFTSMHTYFVRMLSLLFVIIFIIINDQFLELRKNKKKKEKERNRNGQSEARIWRLIKKRRKCNAILKHHMYGNIRGNKSDKQKN